MKRLIRFILQFTLRPFLQNYWLRSVRQSSFGGIKLEVPVSVFHPGLYFSSQFMARFISSLDLQDKSVLDLGSGSGILGLVASNQGAKVTAIDINPMCVEATRKNAQRNQLALEVFHSDLFTNVKLKYDFVFINPPYFPEEPKQPSDRAWYCGKEFTYFDRLFQGIDNVLADHARMFLVLSEVCAINTITSIAHSYGFEFHILEKKHYIFEENYIFEIRATND